MNGERLGSEGDLVRLYLADRDEPCQRCRYNLRGTDGAACPECGESLRLSLAQRSAGSGYRLFLLLAFGWVLLAGGMNAFREGRWIYRTASQAAQTTRFSGQFITVMPGIDLGGNMTLQAQNGVTIQTLVMRNGQLVPVGGPGGPGSMNWSAVPLNSWFGFGWWAALGLAALVGLVILISRRRQLVEHGPPQRLTAFASLLFLCYAGWHLVMFGREVAGLL